jgi:UrcA family protein
MTALRIIISSALITAAMIRGAPTVAEPVKGQNVSVVHTADLDLSSKAGRRQLDQRLVVAARDVCGGASDIDLAGKNQVRACRTQVLSTARAKGEELAARGQDIKVAAR